MHLGQSHQLLRLLVWVGHRIGPQPKKRCEVAPAFLGPEVGLDHGGRVFAIVGELGDAEQRLRRCLVRGVDP
ncbi:MAG: hypothetical protein JRE19_11850, partial [Deltaproteobacteria bacterium]|nr:hypothetical protein [Deltaproteobacteria bacterium]